MMNTSMNLLLPHGLKWLPIFICFLFLGCQRYEVKINDNIVYSPPPLLMFESIQDPALLNCLTVIIEEQKIRSTTELSRISCKGLGIRSLNGMEALADLAIIDLSNNVIKDLSPLAGLKRLQHANLSENKIATIPENEWNFLKNIDLSGNTSLNCKVPTNLSTANITLPTHCN